MSDQFNWCYIIRDLNSYSTKLEELAVEALERYNGNSIQHDPKYTNSGAIYFTKDKTLQYSDLCNVRPAAYYSYTDRCESDCYNYNQMVHAASTLVGCVKGVANNSEEPDVPLNIIVCIYEPEYV
ncbi:unnamed protein product [Mesocestoides corti]|uniref:SCP domain-containing protein n=1 Tax=Mesocestoides corti TaxID=53468 RepID=A0A0R3U6F1_MESCO|nr:unnamed protein product [Mesocestoides corti]